MSSEEQKLSDMELAATPKPSADATPKADTPQAVPGVFGGKTPEQILAEMAEKDRKLQELAEKESRSKHEAEFLQSQLEQLRRGQSQEAKPSTFQPSIPEPTQEEFILNPKEANEKLIKRYLEQDKVERERQMKDDRDRQARTAFEFGRTRAMRERPGLYNGIEQEVAAAVVGAYQTGQADITQLDKPEFWETTASLMRFLRGERNLEKYYTNVPSPVSSMPTERPTATMPPQEAVSLTENERLMAKNFNVSEERLAELKRKAAAEKRV
jgi:hypothetical protein